MGRMILSLHINFSPFRSKFHDSSVHLPKGSTEIFLQTILHVVVTKVVAGFPRDVERIQQSDHVGADGCLLSRARGGAVQEAGGSMPAQVGGDDTMARLYQAGDHVDVAMDVVREPVQEKRDLAVTWTSFEVRNLERISADGSQGFEPWQSSGHHGTWVLASHSSFLVSFHGESSHARSRSEAMSSSHGVIVFSS